jgi:hypothetical protein
VVALVFQLLAAMLMGEGSALPIGLGAILSVIGLFVGAILVWMGRAHRRDARERIVDVIEVELTSCTSNKGTWTYAYRAHTHGPGTFQTRDSRWASALAPLPMRAVLWRTRHAGQVVRIALVDRPVVLDVTR